MDQWKKQSIDNFIIEIENYYLDCSSDYFQNMGIVDKINIEEARYLNDKLDLSKIVGVHFNLILNETLKNKSKNKFSYFLLRSKNISLEVNSLDETKKTVFIRLAENYFFDNGGFLLHLINELFKRNYIIKNEDILFVKDLYKNGLNSQDDFEKWSLLRFAVKLNDAEKFEKAYQKSKELFVILSLKFNKPIHFNFPNLLGILNNAIQHYRENGDIILKAMEVYDRKNKIQELDNRKGNLKRKIVEYQQNKPIQDKKFVDIVEILFPELK
jgi:hypothetical protein